MSSIELLRSNDVVKDPERERSTMGAIISRERGKKNIKIKERDEAQYIGVDKHLKIKLVT